jgi:hypothetical protein
MGSPVNRVVRSSVHVANRCPEVKRVWLGVSKKFTAIIPVHHASRFVTGRFSLLLDDIWRGNEQPAQVHPGDNGTHFS